MKSVAPHNLRLELTSLLRHHIFHISVDIICYGKCRENNNMPALWALGLCLGWKGQYICCITRGMEGGRGGRDGGREVGEGGRERREGGRGREGGMEGGREGGMTVIHILIGMFNSNPMESQYLNNNLTWYDIRNNVSRRSIVPRRTMVRYYVRRDVDILIYHPSITNKLPELVSKLVLSIPV